MIKFFKTLLPLDIQYFADGGEGEPQPQNGGAQQQNDPHDQQHQQQQEPQQAQQQPQEKVFTQEDVNNLIAKEKKRVQEKFLKELGVDDFENAKEGLQKFKEWQESQKTEQEKQAERLQALEKERSSLAEENNSLKSQLAALKAGVKAESVDDVVVLAQKYVSDEVDIDKAIQQVLEKYPHFKAQQEQQQEVPKPHFTTGQHQTTGGANNDPFLAKLAKYHK